MIPVHKWNAQRFKLLKNINNSRKNTFCCLERVNYKICMKQRRRALQVKSHLTKMKFKKSWGCGCGLSDKLVASYYANKARSFYRLGVTFQISNAFHGFFGIRLPPCPYKKVCPYLGYLSRSLVQYCYDQT